MKNVLKKVEEISELLKNFSNPNKLAILCYLGKDEKNVSEIIKCSKISQSQISQYLGRMKLEGILESRKDGKEVYYKISNPKILKIIENLKNIF